MNVFSRGEIVNKNTDIFSNAQVFLVFNRKFLGPNILLKYPFWKPENECKPYKSTSKNV